MAQMIRPIREQPVAEAASSGSPLAPIETSGIGLFTDEELRRIEKDHPDGLTSFQIVDVFSRRGLRVSEATFRKYVQLNLLPRSRRVGRKGKHQGSCGVYPAMTIRRLNAIKRMIGDGLTIEEVQRTLSRFREEIEALERGMSELFGGFERELRGGRFDANRRRGLAGDLVTLRRGAEDLFGSLGRIEQALSAERTAAPQQAGASAGAEPDEELAG